MFWYVLRKKFSRSLFSHLLKFYFRSLILVLYVLLYKKIIFKARLRLLIFISSISNIFFIQKMSGQSVPTWALAAGQDNFEPENFEDVLENALSMYRVNSRTSAKNTSKTQPTLLLNIQYINKYLKPQRVHKLTYYIRLFIYHSFSNNFLSIHNFRSVSHSDDDDIPIF